MHRILTWRRVWKALVVSFCGCFIVGNIPIIRDTSIGRLIVENAAIEWLIAFSILFPARVFLDRREAQEIQADLATGRISFDQLTSSQRVILQHQTFKWPRGLRGLGSRGLERVLVILIMVMVSLMVLPFIVWGLIYLLSHLFVSG